MFNLFNSKKLVGIDIGTSTIKLAEMDVSKNSAKLTSFSIMPTPPGAVQAGEVSDVGSLADAIRTLLDQAKSRRKHASIGVWGAAVVVKRISVPRMDENVLAEQIRWEAEQYIPFDINSINLDYAVLKSGPQAGDSMSVLLIAAQKEFVLRYAEAVEGTGLQCSVIDVNGFAFANCFQHNYGDTGQTVALLNIGAGTTNFVVMSQNEIVFSRDIIVGGINHTTDLMKQMNISLEEAEGIKISASNGQASPQEAMDCIQQTNEVVIEEIQRSFDFYFATVTDTPIQKIYFSGGSVSVPGLTQGVSKIVNIPGEVMNPFQNIGVGGSVSASMIPQIQNFAAVSMGLALRKVGDR